MIKYTTRFSPTLNGYLHLGHLYAMKINEVEAHRSGGKFGIILDEQKYWNWKNSSKDRKLFIDTMLKDLEWSCIHYDFFTSIDELMPQIQDLLENQFHYTPEPEMFVHDEVPEVIGIDASGYPYTDALTTHKVVADFLMSVNWCIRGWDLLNEFSHYVYLTHRFHIPRVRHTLIPKLEFRGDTVSKTEGRFKIKDFREKGASPEAIMDHLMVDCVGRGNNWRIENIITPRPHLGIWVKEYGFEI